VTVLYRGPHAHITQEVYEAFVPARESFPIRELRAVHIVEPNRRAHVRSTWIRLGSLVIAAGAILVAALSWPVIESSQVVVVALLVTALSSATTAGCMRVPAPPLQLRATYRGRPVCLLQTNDRTALGQVSRALVRALERNGDRC